MKKNKGERKQCKTMSITHSCFVFPLILFLLFSFPILSSPYMFFKPNMSIEYMSLTICYSLLRSKTNISQYKIMISPMIIQNKLQWNTNSKPSIIKGQRTNIISIPQGNPHPPLHLIHSI